MDFYDPFRNCARKQYPGYKAAIAGSINQAKNFLPDFLPGKKSLYLCSSKTESSFKKAEVAQLVEHDLAKVGVAGSSPVFRSSPG